MKNFYKFIFFIFLLFNIFIFKEAFAQTTSISDSITSTENPYKNYIQSNLLEKVDNFIGTLREKRSTLTEDKYLELHDSIKANLSKLYFKYIKNVKVGYMIKYIIYEMENIKNNVGNEDDFLCDLTGNCNKGNDNTVLKGTYKGYLEGSQNPFIITENISRADALGNCMLNKNNNLNIKCVWNGEVLYSYNPNNDNTVLKGTYKLYIGGKQDPSIINENVSRAYALSNCALNKDNTPNIKCIWNGEVLYSYTPLKGTLIYNYVGERNFSQTSDGVSESDALQTCMDNINNYSYSYLTSCTWNGKVIYSYNEYTKNAIIIEKDNSIELNKNYAKGSANVILLKGVIKSKSPLILEDPNLSFTLNESYSITGVDKLFDTLYLKIGSSVMAFSPNSSTVGNPGMKFSGLASVNGDTEIQLYGKLRNDAPNSSILKFTTLRLNSFSKVRYLSDNSIVNNAVGYIPGIAISVDSSRLSVIRNDGLGDTKIAVGSKGVTVYSTSLSVTQGNNVSISNPEYTFRYGGSLLNNADATLYVDGVAVSTKTINNSVIKFDGLNKIIGKSPTSLTLKINFQDNFTGNFSVKLSNLDIIDSTTSEKIPLENTQNGALFTVSGAIGTLMYSYNNPLTGILVTGSKNQKLLAFNINASNGSIKLRDLYFSGNNLDKLSNFKILTPNGEYLSNTANDASSITFSNLMPNDSIAKDTTNNYYLIADINPNASDGNVSVSLNTVGSKIKDSNGLTTDLQGRVQNGPLFTISSYKSSLNIVRSDGLGDTKLAVGSKGVTVYSTSLSVIQGNNVNISIPEYTVTSSGNLLNNAQATLYVDGVAISTRSINNNVINFIGLNKVVGKSPVNLTLKVDLQDNFTGNFSVKLTNLNIVDSLTSQTIALGTTENGALFTISGAIGTLIYSYNNPAPLKLTPGSRDQKLLAFNVKATNDSIKLKDLVFSGNNLDKLSNFRILTPNGEYLSPTKNDSSSIIFSNLMPNDSIAKDTTNNYYLIADVNANVANTTFSITLNLNGSNVKSSNGSTVPMVGISINSSTHMISVDKMIISKLANNSKEITTSAMRFSINNTSTDSVLTLNSAYFDSSIYGYTGSATLNIYRDSVSSSNKVGTMVGMKGTLNFYNNQTVSAGQTNNYIVTIEGLTRDNDNSIAPTWMIFLQNLQINNINTSGYSEMGLFPIIEYK